MDAIISLPLPGVQSLSAERRAELARKGEEYLARRRAIAAAFGVGRMEGAKFRGAPTKAEQADAAQAVVPQASVVHRQVIEAAPEYDECLACQ